MRRRDTNPRAIDVHVDELILHGFTSSDHQQIAGTLSAELGRLLAAQGIPATWKGNPERLRAETKRSDGPTNKGNASAQIAHAIYNSKPIAP
jgi:hypothetical protein